MTTTAYESMGVYVESSDMVYALYNKVIAHQQRDDRVEIDNRGVRVLYGYRLTTFRFRYLLPVAIEIRQIEDART